jgi:hypothetical protein
MVNDELATVGKRVRELVIAASSLVIGEVGWILLVIWVRYSVHWLVFPVHCMRGAAIAVSVAVCGWSRAG